MKAPAILVLTVLSVGLAAGDDKKPAEKPVAPLPPVLRITNNVEDSVVVTLPGPVVPERPPAAMVAPWQAPESAAKAAPPAAPEAAAAANPATAPATPPAAVAETAAPAAVTDPATPGSAPATAEAVAPPASPASPAAAEPPAPATASAPVPTTAPESAAAPESGIASTVAAAPVTHPAVFPAPASPAEPVLPAAPAPAPAAPVEAAPAAAPATPAPTPAAVVETAPTTPAAPEAAPAPPAPAHTAVKPLLPEELQAESGLFCQKYIGKWRNTDARALFGAPSAERDSLNEDHVTTGRILAFADPTGRYDQLELDFDHETGLLRSVFAYPRNLTWTQCHRLWAGKINASLAQKGRRFYSYVERKLDVLVDPAGKVISLGWY